MRLAVLALGMFAIGTDTFVIAGILGDIGRDLDVSTSAAGQLVTAFALAYALLSPLLATATASWPRRRVLLVALAVFTLGNLATAMAPNYTVALIARIVTAVGAALYAPNASAAGTSLVPPERRARALALVSGGLGAAMAIGAPLGTWLGGHTGWRATLWLVTALGAIAFVGVAAALRDLPAVESVPLRERLRPLGTLAAQRVLAVTLGLYVAAYTVYPYLEEILGNATDGSAGLLAWALTAFGVGTFGGAVIAGGVTDRFGSRRVVVGGLAGVGAALLLLAVVEDSFPAALATLVVWGAAAWSAALAQIHRMIALAPHSAPVYVSLNASVQYAGIALGSALGGSLLHSTGAHALPAYAGLLLLAVAAFAALTTRSEARVVASGADTANAEHRAVLVAE
ncbi:MAG: MFS transporter [Streptomycetaceae bacterium]|nr:MFS transporter [Streptomycetaceae bacterium]